MIINVLINAGLFSAYWPLLTVARVAGGGKEESWLIVTLVQLALGPGTSPTTSYPDTRPAACILILCEFIVFILKCLVVKDPQLMFCSVVMF